MGSSQVMGPRGASTGDLELPAPSIIPVAIKRWLIERVGDA